MRRDPGEGVFLNALERLPGAVVVSLATLLTVLVSLVDYAAGVDVRLFPLYFLPLSVVSFRLGRTAGLLFSLVCGASWEVTHQVQGVRDPSQLVHAVNLATYVLSFSIVALLIAAQKERYLREEELARVDSLTGLFNARAFRELAAREIERARRTARPLTIAYLDLDHFKSVNDRLGHAAGDALLTEVGAVLRAGVRAVDIVARLGGDEFVVLLPETDLDGARAALENLREQLQARMASNDWPVTASVGAVTFATPPDTVDDLVRGADALMYEVKKGGKNALRQSTR